MSHINELYLNVSLHDCVYLEEEIKFLVLHSLWCLPSAHLAQHTSALWHWLPGVFAGWILEIDVHHILRCELPLVWVYLSYAALNKRDRKPRLVEENAKEIDDFSKTCISHFVFIWQKREFKLCETDGNQKTSDFSSLRYLSPGRLPGTGLMLQSNPICSVPS